MATLAGDKFLNFVLGYAETWSVRVDVPSVGPGERSLRFGTNWVDVRDGRVLEAIVGEHIFPLEFGRKSDERKARRALKDPSGRLLKLIEVQGRDLDDGGPCEASLSFMRTVLPDRLESGPTIVVDEKLLPQIGNFASSQQVLEFAVRNSVLAIGNSAHMVVATPVLGSIGFTEGDAARIYVFLANRKRLACRIAGDRGAEYLVVEEIQERPTVIPDARVIEVPNAPQFVLNEQSVRLTNLATFRPRPHPFLDAWLNYEEIAKNEGLRCFASRVETPLDYLQVIGQPQAEMWKVAIASTRDLVDRWLTTDAGDLRRGIRTKALVEVHSREDGAHNADPLIADLKELSEDLGTGRIIATMRVKDGKALYARGRLVAAEAAQRKRREEAITRLRTGAAACPQMLHYVSDPGSVPAVLLPKNEYEPRKGAPPLNSAQKAAIQRAVQQPGLFLVQGPPGTGKTSVIVELIHALRRRYRNRREDEGGPLRVLVTSVQNDAVLNAIEKLSGDEVQVYADFGSDRKDKKRVEQTRRFLAEAGSIISRLKASVEGDGRFVRFLRLSDLGERIRWLRREVAARRGDAAMVAEVVGLSSTEQVKELPPLLVQKLQSIDASLKQAVQADAELRQQSVAVTAGDQGRPIEQLLRRLTEIPVVAEQAAARQLDIIIKSMPEAWASLLQATVAHQALAREWRTFVLKLQLGLGDAAASKELVARWHDLVSRTNHSFSTEHPVAADAALDDRWARLERDLVEWLSQAAECIGHALAEVARGESAVVFSWIRSLKDEPRRLERVFARHAPVSTATCQRSATPREGVNDGYDVVIVDEAARAGIDILIPMTLGRSVVLIGDQQQLPPHVDQLVAQQMEEGHEVDLQRESFFEWLWTRVPSENRVPLDMQYRMHEAIGGTVSEVFYGGKLRSHWTHELSRATGRLPSFGIPATDVSHAAEAAARASASNHPLVWIDTSDVLPHATERAIRRVSVWPCYESNPYEVAIIETLLKTADAEAIAGLAEQMGGRKTIGIIAFYGEQRKLIEAMVQQLGMPHIERTTEIGTVDSFQGKEYPLVILSAVRSNPDASLGFMALPQRINVAMSRAQRQLIIIGDTATLAARPRGTREPPPMRRVFEAMGAEGAGGSRGIIIPSRMVVS